MRIKLTILIPLVLLCLMSLTVFAQATQSHTVYFKDIDGFSGRVEFTTSREGFATQLRGKNATLFITNYKCSGGEKAALKKAGINLWSATNIGYQPKTFGVIVQGKAYVREVYYYHESVSNDKLHLNQGLGDFTTPKFEEEVEAHAKEYQRIHKKSYWEDHGGFKATDVTTLYITDLKNEIHRILYADKKEKEQKEAEQKEKAEKEKKEAAAKEQESKSGSGSSASNKEKDKSDKQDKDKEDSDKKETKKQTIYIPKTNQQLYEELEAMTKANPGMLNDPKVRKRLRDYKALAGMDSRNRQDLQTYNMVSGGRYNPAAIDYLSRSTVTNANIAAAESAVGDVVDAATGAVNSYFAEKERKEDARTAEYRQQQANAKAKKDAIKKWENDLLEARKVFEEKIAETIEKDGYTLMATIPDLPITYETEKYIAGETYYKGNYAHFTPPSFENETVVMKDWSAPKTYNLYVVELNGLYGILGDNGETIFPPQFEGIYVLQDVEKRARFLVNINNKWGETLADATITEDIKYDGIWYTPDRKNKVLRYDDLWGIKPLDSNQPLKEFTTSQITDLYPGGLIPVYNTLLKSYNDKSGSYSLAADGNVYVWGQAEEKGVIPISYESARRGQTVERLFKINGEWYITANYGTSSMFMVTMPSIFMVPVLRDTENGRKWGVLNQEGEVVVPFEHDYIRRTSNGFATEKGDYNLRN